MRSFAPVSICVRFRKPLSIVLVLLVIFASLHSRGTHKAPLDQSKSPKLPKVSEWLASTSSWTTDEKSDPKFNLGASFQTRQDLGRNLTTIFHKYRPPISQVSKSWLEKWPSMKPFQLDKKYNHGEVVAGSRNFFLEDKFNSAFRRQQQSLIQAIPSWKSVSTAYSGRGIVISAGSNYLRVWPNVVMMLRSLNSSLPIEVWTKDQEEYDATSPLIYQMRTEFKIAISVHKLSDYMSIVWDMMDLPTIFKVKALALLFSSFEEIILLDTDSIPVMDPEVLFDSEEGKSGLIQWPVSSSFWSSVIC